VFCRRCGTENTDASKFCRKCGMPLSQTQEVPEPAHVAPPSGETIPVPPKAKPSIELTPGSLSKVAGVFCYMFGWLSGILFLLFNRKNDFVRFHAWQSVLTFIILTILFILIRHFIIWLLIVFLWLFLMYTASRGKTTRLPGIGNLAQKWSRKQSG